MNAGMTEVCVGSAITELESFEPSNEDRGWWAGRDDADELQDREDALEWIVYMDHLDALRRFCGKPRGEGD